MTDDEARFVEEMGQVLGSSGMTPMAGRVWGWLLICDPPEQTAEQLADELHASRGSISGTARLLATAGLIHRATRRGDRREFFSIPPGALTSFVDGAATIYRRIRQVADHGVAVVQERPPQQRSRIEEFRDAIAYFESEVPAMIERYDAHRRPQRAAAGAGATLKGT